jgi:hypothetical protein
VVFRHVLHGRQLLMLVAVIVGLLFIRYHTSGHGLVEEDIDSKPTYLHSCLSVLGLLVSRFRTHFPSYTGRSVGIGLQYR